MVNQNLIIEIISFVVGIALGGFINRFVQGMVRLFVGIALLFIGAWKTGVVSRIAFGASSVLIAPEISRLISSISL